MLKQIIQTLQRALEKGYLKNTTFDITKVDDIYCEYKNGGVNFNWFVIYDNAKYQVTIGLNKLHTNEEFNADFYCNKCGEFIGRYNIFDYITSFNSNRPIPIDTYYMNNHKQRKLCKSCLHRDLVIRHNVVEKMQKTMDERYGKDRTELIKKTKATIARKKADPNYKKPIQATSIFVYDVHTHQIIHITNKKLSKETIVKLNAINSLDVSGMTDIKDNLHKKILYSIENGFISIENIDEIFKRLQGIYVAKTKSNQYKFYTKINGLVYPLFGLHALKFYCTLYCRECKGIINDKVDLFSLFLMNSKEYMRDIMSVDSVSIQRLCSKCHCLVNGRDGSEKALLTRAEHIKNDPNYLKDIREKTKKTIETRYGGYNSPKWREKFKTSGYIMYNGQLVHNGNVPEIRAKMKAAREKTIAVMSPEKRLAWAKKIMNKNCSKIEKEFIGALKAETGYDIFEHYGISVFHADGFYENTVIEFYGDFFHANPKLYKADEVLRFHGNLSTVKDIWKKDERRIERIKDLLKTNPNFIIVWEHDYNLNKELCIKTIADKLKTFTKNNITNEIYTYSI